jgi:hypothetical protein
MAASPNFEIPQQLRELAEKNLEQRGTASSWTPWRKPWGCGLRARLGIP